MYNPHPFPGSDHRRDLTAASPLSVSTSCPSLDWHRGLLLFHLFTSLPDSDEGKESLEIHLRGIVDPDAAPGLPGGRGGGLEAKGAPWPRTGLYRGYIQLVHSGSGRPRGRYPRYLAFGVLNRLEAPV